MIGFLILLVVLGGIWTRAHGVRKASHGEKLGIGYWIVQVLTTSIGVGLIALILDNW